MAEIIAVLRPEKTWPLGESFSGIFLMFQFDFSKKLKDFKIKNRGQKKKRSTFTFYLMYFYFPGIETYSSRPWCVYSGAGAGVLVAVVLQVA